MALLDKKYVLLYLILFFSLTVRLYELNEPWIGHHDWNSVITTNIARNTIRYGGFLETDFGLISNYYFAQPENITYFIHHPQLPYLSLAAWFYIFGISEWAARLFFVLFSVGSVLSVYLMARKLYDEHTANYAAFFAASLPISVYFGRMVNGEAMVLFLIPMGIYFYLRWLENGMLKHYMLMLVFFVLAQLSEWPAYPLSMVPVIHNLFFAGKKRNVRMMLILVLVSALNFALFAAYFLHFFPEGGDLASSIGKRTTPYLLTSVFWMKTLLRVSFQFTFVVVALSGYLIYSSLKKNGFKLDSRNSILVLFSIMALVNPLIQSESSFIHDYLLPINLIPVFSILAALGVLRLSEKKRKYTMIAFVILAFSTTLFYFNVDTNYDRYKLGEIIGENTDLGETVVVSMPYWGPHVSYYSDRAVFWGVNDMDGYYDAANSSGNVKYFIMKSGDQIDDDFLMYLEGYEYSGYGDYVFFDMGSSYESDRTFSDEIVDPKVVGEYDDAALKKSLKEKYSWLYNMFKFW